MPLDRTLQTSPVQNTDTEPVIPLPQKTATESAPEQPGCSSRLCKRKSSAERDEDDRQQAAARSSVIKHTRKVPAAATPQEPVVQAKKFSYQDIPDGELNPRRVKDPFQTTDKESISWCLPERYQYIQKIGAGAYGCVIMAQDSETNQLVAIKKLLRPFDTPVDAQRTYRELRLLELLKHDNIVPLLDVFTPQRTYGDFREMYMVMGYGGSNLMQVIRSRPLKIDDIKFIVYQILRGLKFIHSAGVIHRDLKPLNIAVTEQNDVRILDFGLARKTSEEMTGYVMTKWWRAPEVMYKWARYDQTVDIWSVGCIMAEMLNKRPLFQGTDHLDHLQKIFYMLGAAKKDFLAKIDDEHARNYIATMTHPGRNFHEVFPTLSNNGIDLLKRMLDVDPGKRVTAAQALQHTFLRSFHYPDDEPVSSTLVNEPYEEYIIELAGWKSMIWTEIKAFDPERT